MRLNPPPWIQLSGLFDKVTVREGLAAPPTTALALIIDYFFGISSRFLLSFNSWHMRRRCMHNL
jgi:hypothetical protein